jgi:hypothetical protein
MPVMAVTAGLANKLPTLGRDLRDDFAAAHMHPCVIHTLYTQSRRGQVKYTPNTHKFMARRGACEKGPLTHSHDVGYFELEQALYAKATGLRRALSPSPSLPNLTLGSGCAAAMANIINRLGASIWPSASSERGSPLSKRGASRRRRRPQTASITPLNTAAGVLG